MTTPYERTRALLFANEFFDYLIDAANTEVPDKLRVQALHIKRHYPSVNEVLLIAESAARGAIINPLLDASAIRLGNN